MNTEVGNSDKIYVIELGEQPGLGLKSLPAHFIYLLGRNDLEGKTLAQCQMFGQIDLAAYRPANHFDDLVYPCYYRPLLPDRHLLDQREADRGATLLLLLPGFRPP